MTSRTLIVAACFAFAAGCQARKTSTHARAEPKQQTQTTAEALPPEPGVDMAEEDPTAEVPSPALGTQVTARVETINRKQNHVVFTVQDDIAEIRLQSGKEIRVPFNDLRLLTGMEKEKAIEVLESADNLKVRVLGVGDAMRIVEIELLEEATKEPVRGEDDD